jgi:hypothetical protein
MGFIELKRGVATAQERKSLRGLSDDFIIPLQTGSGAHLGNGRKDRVTTKGTSII